MSILNDCELFFVRCVPDRPNAKFSPENPTWECQIRTSKKEQKKEWETLGLKVATVDPDEGPVYYKVNLKKGIKKKDGSPADPVKVVDGVLQAIDPGSIGNGSIGNVRIFQYDGKLKDGTPKKSSLLMGIQVTTLVKYVRKEGTGEREDFADAGATTVIDPDTSNESAAF